MACVKVHRIIVCCLIILCPCACSKIEDISLGGNRSATDADADTDTDTDSDTDADTETNSDTSSSTDTGPDEDGDGIVDGDDNCPTYANTGQGNGDTDGIGDSCEWPGRADLLSDITVFDPLSSDQPPQPGLYVYDAANDWSLEQDGLHTNVPDGRAIAHYNVFDLSPPFAIETSFVYIEPEPPDYGPGSTWLGNYVCLGVSNQSNAGLDCCLEWVKSADGIAPPFLGLDLWSKNPEAKLITTQVAGNDTRLDVIRRLRFSQDVDNHVMCTLDNEIGAGAQTSAEIDVSGFVQVRPDITIYNEGAVFQSLVVYR